MTFSRWERSHWLKGIVTAPDRCNNTGPWNNIPYIYQFDIRLPVVSGMPISGVFQHRITIPNTDFASRTWWVAPLVERACAATRVCPECCDQTQTCVPCHHGNWFGQCSNSYWEFAIFFNTSSPGWPQSKLSQGFCRRWELMQWWLLCHHLASRQRIPETTQPLSQ